MQAVMPYVDDLLSDIDPELGVERPVRIQSRSGDLVGWNPACTRFVWRFGFMPGSPLAEAFGVHSERGFLWVISDIHGNAPGSRQSGSDEERHAWPSFWGFACELPKAFRDVINSKKERKSVEVRRRELAGVRS